MYFYHQRETTASAGCCCQTGTGNEGQGGGELVTRKPTGGQQTEGAAGETETRGSGTTRKDRQPG